MFNKSHIEQNEIDPISQVILWFAAIDINVLQKTNRPIETFKYVSLGLLIILACAFAGCSAFVFTKSFVASGMTEQLRLIISTSWGLFVFSIDRFLLTSFKKEEFKASKMLSPFLISIIFRIALIFTIASFVSTEIETIAFESEISKQMIKTNDELIKEREESFMSTIYQREDVKKLTDSIGMERDRLTGLRKDAKSLEDSYLSEVDGTGGSKQRGPGSISDIKQQAWEKKKGEVKILSAAITKMENQRENVIGNKYQGEIDKERKQISETVRGAKGPLDKVKALNDYIESHPEAMVHFYTIKILLVLIELMPMLLKSLAPYSEYDKVLNLENAMHFSFNEEYIKNEKELCKTRMENEHKIEIEKLNALYRMEEQALASFEETSSDILENLKNEYHTHYSEYLSNRYKQSKAGNKNGEQNELDNEKAKKHGNRIAGWILTFIFTGITGTKDTFVGTAKAAVELLKSMFNKSK